MRFFKTSLSDLNVGDAKIIPMQRCLLKFDNAIKTDETRKAYHYQLTRFMKWAGIKDHEGLLQAPPDHIQILLEDYLFYQKKRVSPNTIHGLFSGIELFYIMNDVSLNFKKLHKMFPSIIKKTGSDAWTTLDIKQMLEVSPSKRSKAMIHFFASTGCRRGALPPLKLSNLSEVSDGCKAVLFYEDSNEEYYGFLTPEATKHLEAYLDERRNAGEHLIGDSFLFRADFQSWAEKPRIMTGHAIQMTMLRVIRKSVTRKKNGKRFNIQSIHGFRKRFGTIIKLKLNYTISERLLGHKAYLDREYFRGTKQDMFEEFKKTIPDLTVDNSERSQLEILRQKEEISNLEAKTRKISELEARLEKIEEIKKFNRENPYANLTPGLEDLHVEVDRVRKLQNQKQN
jgi:integrase